MRPLRPWVEPVLESVSIARLCARAGGAAKCIRQRVLAPQRGVVERIWGFGFLFIMRYSVNTGFFAALDAERYTAYEVSSIS